jgi:hypothetical protein
VQSGPGRFNAGMNAIDPVRAELAASRALSRWQSRLLPFMVTAIGVLALFFFVSSFIQLDRLNEAVAQRSDPALDAVLTAVDKAAELLPPAEATEMLRWKTMALLERDVVRQRYGQVNSTLLLRAWTRQMGFVTGMMLAFVGAIFILAKLSDSGTQLNAEGSGLKGALSTSSPGIVLCVLGTTLMLVTLTINFEFATVDRPVYLAPVGLVAAPAAELPPPENLPVETREASDARDAELMKAGDAHGHQEQPLP